VSGLFQHRNGRPGRSRSKEQTALADGEGGTLAAVNKGVSP